MQERIADETASHAIAIAGVARCILWPSVATDYVVCRVAAVGIEEPELRVIEDVECFGAEFKCGRLAGAEVFENGHIEI